jgi:hypothetical protein
MSNPLDLPVFDVTGYAPRHEVTDPGKADALAADMKVHGWQGAPLIVLRDYARALTGVHRLAAAEVAELTEVPGVDAEELLAACGIDLWERREDYGDLDDALEALLAEVPAKIRDAYGLDLR